MKRLLLLLGLSLLALANSATAATIEWANGGGRGHAFLLGDGSRVPVGSLVRIGYFETAGNPTSTFIEFGTTAMNSPGGGVVGGHILGAGQTVTNNVNTTFAGKQLYIWVYNAPTAAASTQQEIFTSVEWTTPADFNTPVATFLVKLGQTADPVVAVTTLQGPGDTLAGAYTKGTVTIGATANDFASIYRLSPVPEPSATLLAGMVGLGLLGRRRR